MLYRRNNDLFSSHKSLHSGFLYLIKNGIQSRGGEACQERGEAQSEDDGGCHSDRPDARNGRFDDGLIGGFARSLP